jgi:poly-gamma-glutamate capsule biosynthesis protein CapA/YwtB (metallophosphatase superfamily)
VNAHRIAVALLLATLGCPGPETDPAANPPAPPSPTTAERRMPLAIVGHATRPPIDLGRDLAERLLDGRVGDWRDVGQPGARIHLVEGPGADLALEDEDGISGGPLVTRAAGDREAVRIVERDFDAIAVVPAAVVGPAVRAFSVDGLNPVRNPEAYPLKVPGSPAAAVTTVFAVGDVMLGRQVGREMRQADDHALPFRYVGERMAGADITFANFEGTMSCGDGRPRNSPPFAAIPEAIEGLRFAGVDVLSLGNGHIGDYGPQGVVETVGRLRDAGFRTTGAGANIARALEPAVVERNGVRFGFLAFNGSSEIPAATSTRAGPFAIPMAPYFRLDTGSLDRMMAAVRDLAESVDVVIVYPHWGDEHTFSFNADQQRVGRALIDAGADLVIGTHPHWVQGLQRYRDGIIVHSLGNFVFDMHWFDEPRRGIAADFTFWGPRLMQMELVPAFIDDRYRPRLLSWHEGLPILERVWGASGQPWRLDRPRPRGAYVVPQRPIPNDSPC